MRELVWQWMLTSQMNACYWNRLARRYYLREKYAKIFLAVTSSGSVAGWSFWASHDSVWKVLSALSALVAIALPILDFSGEVSAMTKLATKCAQLRVGYEKLWAQIDVLPEDLLKEGVDTLAQQASGTLALEAVLPDDRKLLTQCQNEVLVSRGLPA